METFSNAVGNFHHYNPRTGLLCNCLWGAPDEFKIRRTASQAIRAIRNQNQKRFRTPHGERYLNALERYIGKNPGSEPMAAWLASRYKHGDIQLTDHKYNSIDPTGEMPEKWHPPLDGPDEDRLTMGGDGTDIRHTLPGWVQWMNARQHPLRRGVNIMEKSPDEIQSLSSRLQADIEERNRKNNWLHSWEGGTGAHAHTFHIGQADPTSDYQTQLLKKHAGWTVRQLRDREDVEAESDALSHCIGSDEQNYKNNIENGNIEAYSLRDPEGYPKVTWHFNPDGTLAHIQGRSGYPKADWRSLISMFNEGHSKDDDNGSYGNEQSLDDEAEDYDRQIDLDDPTTDADYIDQYHPDADLWDLANSDADNHIGDDTNIHAGNPNWESIFESLRDGSPEERNNFYHTVLFNTTHPDFPSPAEPSYGASSGNNHAHGFNQEVDAWEKGAALNPEEDPAVDPEWNVIHEWRQALNRSYSPSTGAFVQPQIHYSPPDGGPQRWENAWDQANPTLEGWQQPSAQWNQEGVQKPTWGEFTTPYHDEYGNFISPANTPYLYGPRTSNILDPIHDTLDPRVWDRAGGPTPRLKEHHKKFIERTIWDEAKKFAPNPENWLKLVLTGSLTTYQYSDQSDVDISLFVSPNMLPEWDRGKLIGMMVSSVDGTTLPGTPYPLQAFVVGKTISPHDLYQMGLRSGFDIGTGHWLVPPDRTRTHNVEQEYNTDYVYALESADKMERLLRYDPDKAVTYWHQIHKRRQKAQTSGKGDYSQANIIYKFLANRGLFPAISQASGEYIASLPELPKMTHCPNCYIPYENPNEFWQGCHHCGYKVREEAGRSGIPSQDTIDYQEMPRDLKYQIPWIPRHQGKTAGKLDDYLMNPQSRPDLQTPEAQQWLRYLDYINNPKIDPITPWLTREWKKNRIEFSPQAMLSSYISQPNPHEYQSQDWDWHNLQYKTGLSPARLNHWGDWFASNHPTRRGVDIMQMKMPDMHSKVEEWDQAMAAEAEEKRRLGDPTLRGDTIHQFPNGWSVQNLQTPQSLKYEGDTMGHCVGGYSDYVDRGDSMIYSLRDNKNVPHVTMEVTPQQYHPPGPDDARMLMDKHPVMKGSPDHMKDALDRIHKATIVDSMPKEEIPDNLKEFYDPHGARNQVITDLYNQYPSGGANWEALYDELMRNAPKRPKMDKGHIEQIQGQGNSIPKDEYQSMMKNWLATMPEEDRPFWPKSRIDKLEEIQGEMGGYHPHGDYGVKSHADYDWSNIIHDALSSHWDNPNMNDVTAIVDRAEQAGELRSLAQNLEYTHNTVEQDWINDNMYNFNEDEVASWAGLDKEDPKFEKKNPYYDPDDTDEYYKDEPEYEFDERAWEEEIDQQRREMAQDRWQSSEKAIWLYQLESELHNAFRQQTGNTNETTPT